MCTIDSCRTSNYHLHLPSQITPRWTDGDDPLLRGAPSRRNCSRLNPRLQLLSSDSVTHSRLCSRKNYLTYLGETKRSWSASPFVPLRLSKNDPNWTLFVDLLLCREESSISKKTSLSLSKKSSVVRRNADFTRWPHTSFRLDIENDNLCYENCIYFSTCYTLILIHFKWNISVLKLIIINWPNNWQEFKA